MLDVVELALLMDIDQNLPGEFLPEAGALDLARLKHRVAIREDDGRGKPLRMPHRGERLRVKPIDERVIDHPIGKAKDAWVVQFLATVTLERAKIIRIAE